MKLKLKVSDRICSIVFFLTGLFLFFNIPAYISDKKHDVLGARFFPYVIAVLMTGISTALFISTFLSAKYRKEERTEGNIKDDLRVFAFIAMLFASLLIIQYFGFLPGALILVTTTMFLLKTDRLSWFAIVYAVTIAVYLLFSQVLRIRLP